METFRRPPTTLGFEDRPVGETIAVPGQTVTCPQGHPVYRILYPIANRSSPEASWFACVGNGDRPIRGVVPPCAICGQAVFPQQPGSSVGALYIDGRLAR